MSRLRRLNRLCSSRVAGTAYRQGHGSTLCSPTVEKILCRTPISKRSPVSGLRQTLQGKEEDSQEGEKRRLSPSCAPAGQASSFRFASDPLPMNTIIKIDKTLQKGYTNLTRGYGGIGRRARFRFWCPRRAGSSPVTRTSKKNAVESLHSVFLLPIFTWTACSVPSAQSAPSLR